MCEQGNRDTIGFLADDVKLPAIEWLAEQMPGGFFIYQAEGDMDIVYINQAGCHIFGCDSVEEFRAYTGNTFDGMVYPEDYSKIQASIQEQIQADAENQLDYVVYRIRRRDGEIRWVDDYGHYTQLPGFGNVYYVFISDITDTRRMQEEIEKNRRLKSALEEAEQANRAKTAFLSNMSHEIRTPITAILGMNEMIRRESDEEQILYYSDNIHKAGTSLLGIISDILDFTKIEAGKLEIISQPYDVPELIGDLYNIIQFRAEEKGLALRFEVDPRLPRGLVGDSLRIKEVVANLLTNAVKYTEKGEVTLRVLALFIRAGTTVVRFSVSDTGIGIRPEDMPHLFDSFERLDTKRTHTIEGTGLGLPISQQILRAMGSELQVQSTYDVGSTFTFDLEQPVEDAAPVGDLGITRRSGEGSRTEALSFTAPESRILVVDDTPMNLEVISGLLKPTRMQIDTAKSGAECIEKFAIYPYDLVFLDYRMPQMDGIETLEALREAVPDKVERTPIISLTASAVAGERERMLDVGFTDYITKPIDLSEMNEMLLRYLPEEEVTVLDEAAPVEEGPPLPEALERIPWLNTEEGVEYCGDASLYLRALEVFASAIDDKAALIEACVEKGDWNLYTVNVHALKSTSKIIGAMAFSERARALEAAGKAEDVDRIVAATPGFLADYRAMKTALQGSLGSA